MVWRFDFFVGSDSPCGCGNIDTVPFRQKLLKFVVGTWGNERSSRGASVAFEAWKLHEQWGRVARGRWSDEANGVGVGAAGESRKGREPQGDDAVGGRKSDGGLEGLTSPWNFCRSLARDILSTEFNRIRARSEQICNSPAHVVADLSAQWPTSPVFIYDVAEETYKQLHREGIYIWEFRSSVTARTANRCRRSRKKKSRGSHSHCLSTVLSWV